jgi:predicted pyridoxine 5'-phosphate oxidase superfamily flavin-nucleotide-binding protein
LVPAGTGRTDDWLCRFFRQPAIHTLENLADNPKAHLFLIDYTHRRRIKIWGEARVAEGEATLTERLMPDGYKAKGEQVILFTVTAWDSNCSQHIPQRFEATKVASVIADREARIEMLEAQLQVLRRSESASGTAVHCLPQSLRR